MCDIYLVNEIKTMCLHWLPVNRIFTIQRALEMRNIFVLGVPSPIPPQPIRWQNIYVFDLICNRTTSYVEIFICSLIKIYLSFFPVHFCDWFCFISISFTTALPLSPFHQAEQNILLSWCLIHMWNIPFNFLNYYLLSYQSVNVSLWWPL